MQQADQDRPLDVGAILAALRDEVRAQRMAQGRAEPGPIERDLQRSLDEIELTRVVSAHWPLVATSLPQRIVALVNKLVRRYLRWYINPIVEQQNAYNDAVARALRLLAECYADLAEQLADPDSAPGGPPPPEASPPTGQPAPPTSVLQQAVERRAADEPPARLPDQALPGQIEQLRLRQHVSAHWPLSGASPAQRIVALVNKLVRRYLRWYINPIVEQQNAANAAMAAAIAGMVRLDAQRRAQVAGLRARRRR